jgi:RNA polymerase sigma-70 factor (ECF subfamily)
MLALERLSPLERAAFLLHDVFEIDLSEVVAATLEREPAACRKLATRARAHIKAARPRFAVSKERGAQIAHAFYLASRTGDVAALSQLLAEDVVYSDGGGKRPAATKPLRGSARVVRFYAGLSRKAECRPALAYRPTRIDGLPGFVTLSEDGLPQTTAIEVVDDRIARIYMVRNPDKLSRVLAADSPGERELP